VHYRRFGGPRDCSNAYVASGKPHASRRRENLAAIAGKALFKNLELRLIGEAPPSPCIDDRQPAHRCPKTVLMPVHKDKTTDLHHALKAAAFGSRLPTSSTCPNGDSEGDVIEAGQASPDNHISGWWTVFASKVATEHGDLDQIGGKGPTLDARRS